MICRWTYLQVVALTLTSAAPLAAQQGDSSRAAAGPPVRAIATASAVSVPLGSVGGVRELPGGRVLVNDIARRRLLLLDSTLQSIQVVLDSSSAVANSYGARPGTLLPFAGDSSLFVDQQSYAALVIDPSGRLARVRSVWNVAQINDYTSFSGQTTRTFVDGRGRVIYQISPQPERPKVAPPPGIPYIPTPPDSAFVIAVNLNTRHADTLGIVRVPRTEMRVSRRRDGNLDFQPTVNPIQLADGWAVLSDGTVAFVRGRDYRVEYLHPDGSRTSSAKLPYPWVRLTDQDKEHVVDSVRTSLLSEGANVYVSSMIAWINQNKRPYPRDFQVPAGYRLPPGLPRNFVLPAGMKYPDNYLYSCEEGQGQTQVTMGPGGSVSVSTSTGGPAPSAAAAAEAGRAAGAAAARTAMASGGAPAANQGAVATVAAPTVAGAPTGATGQPGNTPANAAGAVPAGAQATTGGVTASPPDGEPQRVTIRTSAPGAAPPPLPPLPAGGASGPGGPMVVVQGSSGQACVQTPPMYFGRQPPNPPTRNPAVVPVSALPDYRPPIGRDAVRADLDGNLWIRTLAPQPAAGVVFDIVNSEGVLSDRLQIPTGYTVVGFGKGRVVYLSMRDAAGVHLARVGLR